MWHLEVAPNHLFEFHSTCHPIPQGFQGGSEIVKETDIFNSVLLQKTWKI